MDLFLSMRSVACIQFSGSSQPATKENAPFSHSQNRKFFSDRRNGETPDKIGGFLGNIFFIAHRWQGQKDLVSPTGSVGASKHLRCLEVSTGDPHPSTRSACLLFNTISTT